jgi:hypothetical protein
MNKNRRKIMRRAIVMMATVGLVLAFLSGVTTAQQSKMDQIALDYPAAQAAYEEICSKCHGLDRPDGVDQDAAGWSRTIARMSSNHQKSFGEPIGQGEQRNIQAYLTARDAFEIYCDKCHSLSRPLGRKDTMKGWAKTVAFMAKKHLIKFEEEIPAKDADLIAKYLSIVAGK